MDTPACQSLSSWLGYQIDCRGAAVLVFKSSFFYFTKAPKGKSSAAGNSAMPEKL